MTDEREKSMSIRGAEEKLFAELKAVNPDIVEDGIVDETEYLSAKIKIVYLMKEVNGGSAWDLREFLQKETICSMPWNTVARWTEGILCPEGEKTWKDHWTQRNEERRRVMLKKIGVVNLKKISGSGSSDMEVLRKAAGENRVLLQRQLELYKPQIIICCGTAQIFADIFLPGKEWKCTSRGIWYFVWGSTAIIEFYHPGAYVRQCLLHYGLVDAVREIQRLEGLW